MDFSFITKPFGLLMMFFYNFTGSYGLAVILFALVVKLIMLPFQMKSKRSMMKTGRLQPRMKELEKKHGANKQKYQEEVAKLYKEEKINPMSGCLWSLLPFPIIIALYTAISQPLTIMMGVASDLVNKGGAIYNLIQQMGGPTTGNYLQIYQAEFISKNFSVFQPLSSALHQIDFRFLGMDLGLVPNYQFLWQTNWNDPSVWFPGLLLFLLPVVSGVLAYISSRITTKLNPAVGNAQQQSSTKTMMLMMPLISVYFGFIMPGGIGVYMISQTVFSMIQEIILTKHYTKILNAEDAVKLEQQRIKEEELEAKRQETERKKLENKTEVNPNTSKKKQQKTERQEQLEKQAEWEKKNNPTETVVDPSRVDNRRFARGRAYDPNRFAAQADEAVLKKDEESAAPPDDAADNETDNAVYDPESSSITFENTDEQTDEDAV